MLSQWPWTYTLLNTLFGNGLELMGNHMEIVCSNIQYDYQNKSNTMKASVSQIFAPVLKGTIVLY